MICEGHMTTRRRADVLNSRRVRHILLGIVAVSLMATTASRAHEVDRSSGFYLGASLMGSTIDAKDAAPQSLAINENGGGLQLRAGYLFNPKFSLELALAGFGHSTSVDSVRVGQGALHINTYYHFRGDRHLRPFIKGGIGFYGLNFEVDNGSMPRVAGAGLAFGAGLEYFVSSHVSFDLDVTHHIINYGQTEEDLGGGLTQKRDIDEDGSLTTLGLGIAVYF